MEDDLKKPGPYCNDPLRFGLSKFNYYECSKCKSLYFGGTRQCGEDPVEDLDKSSFICGGCRGCAVHGLEGITFKCRHCCAVADWFCFGHTHFCTPCHNRAWDIHNMNNQQYLKIEIKICAGKDKCPLGIEHPPHGEEFILKGCSFCSEEQKGEAQPEKEKSNEKNERKESKKQQKLAREAFENDEVVPVLDEREKEIEEKKENKSLSDRFRSLFRSRW